MKRTSHKSFNPFEFSTSTDNSEYTESESKEEGDKILTKGDGNFYYLDFNKVEKEVQELLKNPNTKISDLQGADKKRFDYLRLAAQMFYDTDKYKCFYDRVTKYCKTVPDPMPGTIGGYVCGCLASQNFIEPMCTSVCADGLAMPKDATDFQHCTKMVIWATNEPTTTNGKSTDNYKFKVIKDGTKEPAYLFLDVPDIHSFKGFSVAEKTELEQYNITSVKVFGTQPTPSGNTYTQLNQQPMSINDLKIRRTTDSYLPSTSNIGIGIVILVIIIILILLAIFCGGCFLGF